MENRFVGPSRARPRPAVTLARAVAVCLAGALPGGCNEAPMTYMRTFAASADPVTRLGWGLTTISLLVIVIVGVLLLAAIFRRRPSAAGRDLHALIERRGNGLSWLYVGVGISTLVLFGSAIWMLATLSAVAGPAARPALTMQVIGHSWWWEVRYLDQDPSRNFVTANEIHVPVGRPVRIELRTDDVIHSFWVPALTGKTDLIPGQTNVTWIEASAAGVYRGQCGEYCGLQHAHMALFVVADPPDKFEAWQRHQLEPSAAPALGAADGRARFEASCGACHTVRGTAANGTIGPDLTHLMTRQSIAAGILPNTIGNLAGWVADPQAIKPGAGMPAMGLAMSGAELRSVVAYLESLR